MGYIEVAFHTERLLFISPSQDPSKIPGWLKIVKNYYPDFITRDPQVRLSRSIFYYDLMSQTDVLVMGNEVNEILVEIGNGKGNEGT